MATKTRRTNKAKFDYINFAYGVGAAVILVAAMFKFLGWDYANEIFIIGLTSEAIVFLISAFQWKSRRKSYKWERVFPGLTGRSGSSGAKADLSEIVQAYYKNTETIIGSTDILEKSLMSLEKATETLTESVNRVKNQINRIEKSAVEYEEELEMLKSKISKTNEFYADLYDIVKDSDDK